MAPAVSFARLRFISSVGIETGRNSGLRPFVPSPEGLTARPHTRARRSPASCRRSILARLRIEVAGIAHHALFHGRKQIAVNLPLLFRPSGVGIAGADLLVDDLLDQRILLPLPDLFPTPVDLWRSPTSPVRFAPAVRRVAYCGVRPRYLRCAHFFSPPIFCSTRFQRGDSPACQRTALPCLLF